MVRVTDYLTGRIDKVRGEGSVVYDVFWKDNFDNGIYALVNYERLLDLVSQLDRSEIKHLEADLMTDDGKERLTRGDLSVLLDHYKRQNDPNKAKVKVSSE